MRNDVKSRTYAIGELARLSGVSIRALRHYDETGLLKPASVGENGYRHYGREELLRLQQILFHRDLGMSLADIAHALDAPGFDRLAALRRQRATILAEAERRRRLLDTIDRTIAELEGERTMQDIDFFKGFTPEKQAAYEAYILETYTCADAVIDAGRRRMAEMTRSEVELHMAELAGIEGDLARAVESGVAPDDPILVPVLARHHAWVAVAWGGPPTAEAYAGLGQLYATHPDFVVRYETLQPGLAAWLPRAMVAFASTL